MTELVKEKVKGKNEVDVEELVKLLNQHLAQPDRPVRRNSGRRGQRTRSGSSPNETPSKKEADDNNNESAKPAFVATIPMALALEA